jgi:hypothetical protein
MISAGSGEPMAAAPVVLVCLSSSPSQRASFSLYMTTEVPVLPALPVRPLRCRKLSASWGMS